MVVPSAKTDFVSDFRRWTYHLLLFFIGNERQWSKYLYVDPIELLGVKTNPAKSTQNLDVIFEKKFTFCSHISAVCSSCFYHMRHLRCIHNHVDLDSVTALVSSRLNYCNSLLYDIMDTDLTKLQFVQNRLVCAVTKSPPFTRTGSVLRLFSLLVVFHCFVPFIGYP